MSCVLVKEISVMKNENPGVQTTTNIVIFYVFKIDFLREREKY